MAQGVDIGTAWVTIAAEMSGITKDIEKGLGQAGEDGGKAFSKGLNKSAKDSGGALEFFEKNSTKMLVAATAAGGALFGLASAAGSLNAALQTSDRVFGDASDSVQAFAADTSDAVFLSESAALQAANAFGIFGSQAGMGADEAAAFSIRMVQMAADLAAVADVPVEQAILDMRSAFAGSTETMQKYGINLNETELKAVYFAETGERITGVMTAQQKTMAVHWALLEKGEFAFGAAESEATQFAAQMDRLKGTVGNMAADFGQPAVDFASGLLAAVSTGLEHLVSFNDATGGMLATGLSASIGISALGLAAGGVIGKVSKAAKWFGTLGTASKVAVGALGGLALAATVGFTAYGLLTRHSRELAEQSEAAAAGMRDAAIRAWDYADAAAAAGASVSGLAIANSTLGLAVLDTFKELDSDVLGRFNISAKDLGDTLMWLREDPVSAMRSLGKEANLTEREAGALAMVIAVYGSTSDDLATSTNNLGYNLSQVRGEFELSQEEAFALAQRIQPLANDMEDLWDAANTAEFDKYAASLLNAAVTTSDWSKETITGIEASEGLSRETGDAVQILALYYEALAELSPEQRDAALGAGDLADGLDDAGDAASGMETPVKEMSEVLSIADKQLRDTADAASAFDDMVRRLTDPVYRQTRAHDDLAESVLDVDEAIQKAKKGEDGYSLSMDRTTREGLRNRDMFADRVDAIKEVISTDIAAGSSAEQLTGQYEWLRSELVKQLDQYYDNDAAIEEYLASMALTPDYVTTTIELVGQDEAREQIEEVLGDLSDLDRATYQPAIQPWIDMGEYQKALNLLNALAAPRTAKLNPKVNQVTARNGATAQASAYGNYVPANSAELHWVGETAGDEQTVHILDAVEIADAAVNDSSSDTLRIAERELVTV